MNDFVLYFQKSPILNLCTGNRSWWFSNGIGCNASSIDESKDYVQGCLLQYYYVEVIHAGAQCLLSVSRLDPMYVAQS